MTQTKKSVSYLLDFDSTFIKSEGLDVLAEISLSEHPRKNQIVSQIKDLTELGMEGKISFEESLNKRILLLETNRDNIEKVASLLKKRVSASIQRNKEFFDTHRNDIYIISGGFKELILPVVKSFGIPSEHVFANTFTYDEQGRVIGVDKTNVMSKDQGKVNVVKSLKLSHELYIIGDGYTDYELKKLGLANKFIAFTENVIRDNVVKKADEVASTFDEFLYVNKLPRSLSYPKNRIKVLLQTEISEHDLQYFEKEGYEVIKQEDTELNQITILCVDGRFKQVAETRVPFAIGAYEPLDKPVLDKLQEKGIAAFSRTNIAQKIVKYINSGSTAQCLTIPNLQLPKYKNSHRLLHIHKNVPGILAQINKVMADHQINILGQYLKTDPQIGYVIIDVDKEYDNAVLKALKTIPHTIRFRVLY
jgi:D-3-phosphoglycerate dehydrogenase / 2-oxoglutarate reductase